MRTDETFRQDGTLVERTIDNGDGTGTRQTFDAEGNVTSTENLTGLPIPVEVVTREDIEDDFAAALEAAQTLDEIRQAAAARTAAIAALENP